MIITLWSPCDDTLLSDTDGSQGDDSLLMITGKWMFHPLRGGCPLPEFLGGRVLYIGSMFPKT